MTGETTPFAGEADASPGRRRDWRRGRSLAFALALGAVSWAWSEVAFWSHFRVGDNPAGWVATWLLYSLVTYVCLRVLRWRPATGLASAFLVGAVYGWLVEGMVANTVYLILPFSVVWTGLAWHALLTVVVGWYALPLALRRGGRRAVAWCSLIGAAWGLWEVGWWGVPPDEGQVTAASHPASYALFVTLVTAVAGLGYGLQHALAPGERDLASPWSGWAAIGLLVAWSIPVAVIPLPFSPIVEALLLGVALVSLRRFPPAGAGPRRDVLGWRLGVPWRRLGPLAAIPLVAMAVTMAGAPVSGPPTGTGVVYGAFVAFIVGLSLIGSALLVWSLWRAWRQPRGGAPV